MQRPLFRILKNFGVLTAATLFGRLLNFVILAIVVRTWGADGLGGYATATAVAGYFLIVADMGLSARLVHETAAHPASAAEKYERSLGLKMVTTLLTALLLGILLIVLPYENWVLKLMALCSIASVGQSFNQLNHAVLRAHERMELEALGVLAHSVVFGCAAATLFFGLPLIIVGWGAVAATLLQLIVSCAITSRFLPIRIGYPPHWATVRQASPYTMTSLLAAVFSSSDVVVLSLIASQSLVGEFVLITRLLLLASIFPLLLNLAVLPISSRIYGRGEFVLFSRVTTASLRSLAIIAGAFVVGLATLAKVVLHLAYGSEFVSFFWLLGIGASYLFFYFLNCGLSVSLTSSGRQTTRVKAMLTALVAKFALVCSLTPLLGTLGAVLAYVLTEAMLLLCQMVGSFDLLERVNLARTCAWVTGGIGVALSARAGLLALEREWLAIFIPIIIYAGILLASREIQKLIPIMRDLR